MDSSSRDYRHIIQDLQGYSDVYGEMDFATRDRYRHAVERIAKESRRPEWQVAMLAVQLTQNAANAIGVRDRSAHVGYFLIDRGLPELEKAAHARIRWGRRSLRLTKRAPLLVYLGGIGGMTLLISAIAISYARQSGASVGILIIPTLLSLIGSSQLSIAIANWIATLCVKPTALPRLDFSDGIPAECRTLIAIPTMLTSPDSVSELVEALEVRYLANRTEHFHFALLSDLPDAETETSPNDQALIEQAQTEIQALNDKYKDDRHDIFFLFHRAAPLESSRRRLDGVRAKARQVN